VQLDRVAENFAEAVQRVEALGYQKADMLTLPRPGLLAQGFRELLGGWLR